MLHRFLPVLASFVLLRLPLGAAAPPFQDAPAAAPAAAAGPVKTPGGLEPAGPRGLRLRAAEACPGWTLIAPLNSTKVHLVDLDGTVVHTWETEDGPGGSVALLDNGNLLRCGRKENNPRFHGGGIGGNVQELGWNGELLWEYELAGADRTQHHEVQPLPNGNVLLIAWEYHSKEEAVAHGRDAAATSEEGFWPDVVLEVRPLPPAGGEVVWTWRAWDHLVQDLDPAKPGYGRIADFPGRIDINADHRYRAKEVEESAAERERREKLAEEMRALGYAGGGDEEEEEQKPPAPPPRGPQLQADWLHTNSVDYWPEHDLIALSTPHLCEIWVIDHSTTTEEAAGSSGGRWGRGGEILWRWGNPRNYGASGAQRLFYQHDATWLASAAPGEIRLLLFNNGGRRSDGDYSSVEELLLPFDPARGFPRAAGQPYGPAEPAWIYADRDNFFSAFISGAQRLANGNTLVCSGAPGHVFEVTPAGRVVWDYLNPLGGELPPSPQGGRAPPKALFRATRIAHDHPGVKARLAAATSGAVKNEASGS